jgi:4a-hydroxytetrahydrobiopterin dehydratase
MSDAPKQEDEAHSKADVVASQSSSNVKDTIGAVGTCPKCGCVGPNPGYVSLTEEDVKVHFQLLRPGFWRLSPDHQRISRTFTARNFKAAIDFINEAAIVAEREDIQHHPELHITRYRDVTVELFTHSAEGLTEYDFKLAKALEGIQVDYSPKWLKENAQSSCI